MDSRCSFWKGVRRTLKLGGNREGNVANRGVPAVRGQTALEYLLIIGGVTLLVLLVLVVAKAVIDSGWLATQPLLDQYNQSVVNATR